MLRFICAALLVVASLDAQTPAGKTPAWLQGRWTTVNIPAAFNFVGDSVEVMIIPLQGPLLSYRLNGARIEVKAGQKDGPPADMLIRRDTLILTQGGRDQFFTRLGSAAWDSVSLVGSWRNSANGRATVLTFRSDGALISENGSMSDPNIRGDTLDISFGAGQSMRYIFRKRGDKLYIRAVIGGPEQAYVRRPWGCFGMEAVNAKAKECR
jgi:hypothetical protein